MVNRSIAPRTLYYQALLSQVLSVLFISIVIVLVVNSGNVKIFLVVSSFWLFLFGLLYIFLKRFIFFEIKDDEVTYGSVFFKDKVALHNVNGLTTILGIPYQGIYSINISERKYFFFAAEKGLNNLKESLQSKG